MHPKSNCDSQQPHIQRMLPQLTFFTGLLIAIVMAVLSDANTHVTAGSGSLSTAGQPVSFANVRPALLTPTVTPSPTATDCPQPACTPTSTWTPTSAVTSTASPTNCPINDCPPTSTVTPTETPTPCNASGPTCTPTPTYTPCADDACPSTATPTAFITATPTTEITPSCLPGDCTPTPTSTICGAPGPTCTPTPTKTPCENSACPPTPTPTGSNLETPTGTATPPCSSDDCTPTPSATPCTTTECPTSTPTATMTPTQPTSTVTATQETATPQATETPTAQPSNTPTPTPTIQLAISKEAPEIALAGAPITYVLTVRNISQIHASNITVVDTLPAAATYLASPGGLLLAETNQVQWSIAALPPGATIQVQLIVSATHTLINSEYKAEIPGVHQVIGSEPVLTLIGQETTTGAVEAETGGSLTSSSGDLSVAVPAGAITSPVTLTIVTLGEPLNQAGFSGIAFSITAIDSIGNKIAQFGQPLTLTFRYTDADWQNAGISDERAMNLYFWDSLAWRPLLPCAGCSQDLESNTFTVLVDHLTLFALRQSPGQIYLPLVQN